jgi:hypothetical protein
LPVALMSGRKIPVLDDDLVPEAILIKPFDIDYRCTVVDVLTQGARSMTAGGTFPQV